MMKSSRTIGRVLHKSIHIVALSGGKDSTAMALRLKEITSIDYTFVCTPTGDELPEMYEHWNRLSDILGKPILPIMGGTLKSVIDEERMLPNFRARFCTRKLKIEPFAKFLLEQSAYYNEIYSYVGIRFDEPKRQSGDYAKIPNVISVFPLREWGWRLQDVQIYLQKRGVTIPSRTDCARCFFQRLDEWWLLWRDYPELYLDAESQELKYNHTFRSPKRDTQPTSLKDLREKFETGWAPKKAQQKDLFGELKCRVCQL